MRRGYWVALTILLLASAARLHQVILTDFAGDEGELSRMALDFVHGREFPTRGLFSSQGVYHPPAMVYVMAVPYAVSSHPLVAVIFVTLWNILGVALLFRIAHRCFGLRAAALAGITYAVSPWALLYSHKTFPQNIHTPFLLLAVWFGLKGFGQGRRWAQALFIPVFSLVSQIHLAGVALLPLVLFFAWMGRKKLHWGAVGIGFLLALLTIVPFLADLGERDFQQFRNLVSEDESEQEVNTLAFRRMVNFAAGLQLENYFTNDVHIPDFEAAAGWRPKILWLALAGIMLLGMVVIWLKRTRPTAPLVIAWVFLPVLVTSTGAFFPLYHYLNLILPAQFLLIGVGAAWLSQAIPVKKLTLPALGLILVTQTAWYAGAVGYAGEHYLGPHSYGQPLKDYLPVREHLLQYDDIINVGAGVNTNLRTWGALLYDAECVREIGLSVATTVVIPDGAFAVSFPEDAQANLHDDLVRSIYTSGRETLYPGRENVTPHRVYEFDSPPEWTGARLLPVDAPPFDNGARLVGYRHEADLLILQWTLAGKADQDYLYFAHYLDESGEKLGQIDVPFYPGDYWCAGDTVYLWIYSPLPEGAATIRIGMYSLNADGGYVNSHLPNGDWLDLPVRN